MRVVGLFALVLAVTLSRKISVVAALLVRRRCDRRRCPESAFSRWPSACGSSSLGFTGVIALPAIFVTPGRSSRGSRNGRPITEQGLRTAALLILRVETAVTFTTLLVLCTPWTHVLKALRAFRLPKEAIAMLAMTYRYVFLLVETASQMFESRRSRTVGVLNADEQRRMAARTAGVLLSKSIDLSNDVYLAMQSRGFRGDVQVLSDFRMTMWDYRRLARFLAGRQLRRLDGKIADDAACSSCATSASTTTAFPRCADSRCRSRKENALALLGANGSGKSTLLRMLDGLCFPSQGSRPLRGQQLTAELLQRDDFALPFRRRVALVFQNPDVQLFNPTVFDEVAFAPLQLQWSKEQVLSRG